MQDIRTQRDLQRLPQPRLIFTAKPWVRRAATGFLACGGLLGLAVATGIAGSGTFYSSLGGTIAAATCLAALVFARPHDWQAWVSLAATQDGLYLTAQRSQLVFVPWQDVIEIGIERLITARSGPQNFPKLTLRLSETDWSLFGNTSGIKGTGPVRTYIFSSVSGPAELMIDQLKTFRGTTR